MASYLENDSELILEMIEIADDWIEANFCLARQSTFNITNQGIVLNLNDLTFTLVSPDYKTCIVHNKLHLGFPLLTNICLLVVDKKLPLEPSLKVLNSVIRFIQFHCSQ